MWQSFVEREKKPKQKPNQTRTTNKNQRTKKKTKNTPRTNKQNPQNSPQKTYLNCSFPGNERLQGEMDQKIKESGCVGEIGCRVNRQFTKLSHPDTGLSQYAQYALLPKSPRAKSPSTWCKTRMKRPIKGEGRIAQESQANPLPQWKEKFATFTLMTSCFSCHKVIATEKAMLICKFL